MPICAAAATAAAYPLWQHAATHVLIYPAPHLSLMLLLPAALPPVQTACRPAHALCAPNLGAGGRAGCKAGPLAAALGPGGLH